MGKGGGGGGTLVLVLGVTGRNRVGILQAKGALQQEQSSLRVGLVVQLLIFFFSLVKEKEKKTSFSFAS